MCSGVTIVHIKGTPMYGILQQRLVEVAVINLNSNKGGLCITVGNDGYEIIPHNMWDTLKGEVIIFTPGGGHISTGLKIWKE